MDKKVAGLLGAVAALATLDTAQAAAPAAVSTTDALNAQSYAELLAPVPNAMATLVADDAARSQQPVAKDAGSVQVAQYHHHHHRYRRHRHRHHHHHHHHHSNYMAIPRADA